MSATRHRAGRRRVLAAAAPLAAVAILGTACGGGFPPPTQAEAGPSLSGTSTLVGTQPTRYGTVLSDGLGATLYMFDADRPGRSACSGDCLRVWQPYIAEGTPQPDNGTLNAILEDRLQTFTRTDGRVQVSYNGHPLYRYSRDEEPGQARGQDVDQFGGTWYVLSPKGRRVAG